MSQALKLLARAMVLACAIAAAPALAQAPAPGAAPCPAAMDTAASDLYGLWSVRFSNPAASATLLLERHPDYAESVSGVISRDGAKAFIAGDVEDGEFTLEESADGLRIGANWSGRVVEGSCGREIQGEWKNAADGAARAFTLRKQ